MLIGYLVIWAARMLRVLRCADAQIRSELNNNTCVLNYLVLGRLLASQVASTLLPYLRIRLGTCSVGSVDLFSIHHFIALQDRLQAVAATRRAGHPRRKVRTRVDAAAPLDRTAEPCPITKLPPAVP